MISLRAQVTPRDYTEDFPLENGNYMCKCFGCKQLFTGHKRRVVCKRCSTEPE